MLIYRREGFSSNKKNSLHFSVIQSIQREEILIKTNRITIIIGT